LKQVTRFLSLAKFTPKGKPKNLYAFQIIPSIQLQKKDLVQQPDNTTECPYKEIVKHLENEIHAQDKSQVSKDQFFFDSTYKPEEHKRRKKDYHDADKSARKKKFNQASDNCWFCLASPHVEKHLIVSIGDFCYLAMAKGGLVSEHCLILPIGHHR
jgi:CWF19-like protein 1